MKTRSFLAPILLAIALPTQNSPAADEVPAHQARMIFDAAPAKARVTPARARRVLIWNTPAHLMEKDPHKGYCIPYGAAAMEALGKKTGAFEPVTSGDLALYLPPNLAQFDAIFMNNSSGSWITPTADDLKREAFSKHGTDKAAVEQLLRQSLLDYVNRGGGIVAIHYAIAANRHWPAFQELLGATFTGHPWNEEVGVTVEDPTHPLVAAYQGKDFRLADEIYQYGAPYNRRNLRVLLSLDPERTNMGVPWIDRNDRDFALAWVKASGQGRVFYTSFGHRTELFWDPLLLQFYLDAIQFATGDLAASTTPNPLPNQNPEPGFVPLFNGQDLTGWDGDRRIWSVRDGAITGQTTPDVQVKQNTFLIWQGGQPKDFELRLQFKLVGGNSGIYFHAEKQVADSQGEPLVGPQADFSADHRWTGVLMEYTKREILAERGQRVEIDPKGRKQVVGSTGDPQQLLKAVNDGDWNEYHVVARGETVLLKINGVTMCEVTDHDPRRVPAGHLALQIHTGPPMTVQLKNIRIQQ